MVEKTGKVSKPKSVRLKVAATPASAAAAAPALRSDGHCDGASGGGVYSGVREAASDVRSDSGFAGPPPPYPSSISYGLSPYQQQHATSNANAGNYVYPGNMTQPNYDQKTFYVNSN